ncbi:MAG: hypothetical protein ACJAS1_003735 [Oleiphilaceae bacterium]|jgi:hypothetical protein
MSIGISKDISGLTGRRVNDISLDQHTKNVVIYCRRDRRKIVIDPLTEQQETVNRYVRRTVRDLPLFGYPCPIEIALA